MGKAPGWALRSSLLGMLEWKRSHTNYGSAGASRIEDLNSYQRRASSVLICSCPDAGSQWKLTSQLSILVPSYWPPLSQAGGNRGDFMLETLPEACQGRLECEPREPRRITFRGRK